MNPQVANVLSTLLGVLIQTLLTDPYYRELIARMQSEGRDNPTPEEMDAVKARVIASRERREQALADAEARGQ